MSERDSKLSHQSARSESRSARIAVIYGTRPEAIKCAPLVKALEAHPALDPTVIVTGQHTSLVDQVHATFRISADHDLNLMEPGQPLGRLSGRVTTAASAVLRAERPDAVVVHGDTSSSTAAALAAFSENIPVVHLEAGLRSHDLGNPFPEEGNRRMTAAVTALHLCPTNLARRNLLDEGVVPDRVTVTGNTVVDALLTVASSDIPPTDPALQTALAGGRRLVLLTLHRRESWGPTMSAIAKSVRRIVEAVPDIVVLCPMHPNPMVRETLTANLGGHERILLTEPLEYTDLATALRHAHLVLTDSGGIQEEAPTFGVPVLVLRDTTERPEAIDAGCALLVGTRPDAIFSEATRLFLDADAYRTMTAAGNPYGDGHAGARAAAAIAELVGAGSRLPDYAPDGDFSSSTRIAVSVG
ncbi:UDP-N-acetylglucosamine 2-epimerase (non-hydrolysing) [Rhodococcus sp. AG1013]|uniref:non-hydrolyzing UDP-N-acetylglucosamine 2-epimerase n=1 Tax=Rhodococcus sp. AG1013 TaxID=2183996 RepID=UPI000E0CB85B|nr:UDP-N-acetylglucosamine 2-epimerase (non-hydrolyzing) [Rhodococcus sp. AG1013]RDI28200.1 UDP-N-acetylglucosamine 2-epimerase (non-hydrolysing) [Rhodococcus sp. AG1013]